MPASDARKARRAKARRLRALGADMVERIHLPFPPAHVTQRDRVDVLVWEVARAIKGIAQDGADLDETIAVTIGKHPSFPDGVTIEAKATRRKPSLVEGEIAIAPMTEADLVTFRAALGIDDAEHEDDEA